MKTTIFNSISNVGFINKIMFPHWTRLLIWSLNLPSAPYMNTMRRILHIWSCNGSTYVVLYLKECVRIIQAFVSGHPILQTNEAIVGLKGGLPQIIHGDIRVLIRQRNHMAIRGSLSLLSVYRVIKCPGKLKLESITEPFTGLSSTLPKYELIQTISHLSSLKLDLKAITLKFLSTAGPNHPTSMLGLWKDLIAWRDSGKLSNLIRFIRLHNNSDSFANLILQEYSLLKDFPFKGFKLGKLSLKEEAAGKIRVFAIADAWTQSVMYPLSEGIFKILKSLPMDGTFNQDQPLKRLVSRVKEGLLLAPTFYSYDLSAATDRLPIDLQRQILSIYLGEEYADLWKSILTDRDWYLKDKTLRYSVGQPMGALSSWAMLALTHHIIVRLSARRLGLMDFVDYAILGDDVVIAHEGVAKVYHQIMTEVLGVKINLSKSLISNDSFEFAKRLITLDGEVTPVGAKNLLVGLKSIRGLPSIILDCVNKGVTLDENIITSMYKSVPTLRVSQVERMKWLVLGPFGFIPTADGLTASMRLTNSLSAVMMDSLLSTIDEALYRVSLSQWEGNCKRAGEILYKYRNIQSFTGFTYSSPLLDFCRNHWLTKANQLISEKPVRRFIFDGPLVFTNYYRESWMSEMMNYITKKIKSQKVIVPLLDPFQDEKVILPLSQSKKSENFWLLVRDIEKEKSLLRGYRGWI